MQTPPQNIANRQSNQYNQINRNETPVNQLRNEHEEFTRPEKHDLILRGNYKGSRQQQSQPSEQEIEFKMRQDLKKLFKYIDDTNWMFDINKEIQFSDFQQTTL